MAELPAWIQEAKDRAEAVSKGPWYAVDCEDRDFAMMLRVATAPDSERPEDTVAIILLQMPLEACVSDERWDENGEFIAAARTDVPRLVETAAAMAELMHSLRRFCANAYEAFRETNTPGLQLDAFWLGRRIDELLRKYRGEVDKP